VQRDVAENPWRSVVADFKEKVLQLREICSFPKRDGLG